jgi:hypothetical protein
MVAGTLFVVSDGFSSVVQIGGVQLYAALVALVLNLAVACGVTAVARRRGMVDGFGPSPSQPPAGVP